MTISKIREILCNAAASFRATMVYANEVDREIRMETFIAWTDVVELLDETTEGLTEAEVAAIINTRKAYNYALDYNAEQSIAHSAMVEFFQNYK